MALFIKINEIQDGQILAESVLNNYGQVLLPSGIVLKEKHKNLFKTWNIQSVHVKSEESEEDSIISDEVRELALLKFKERCTWKPRNKNEEDLYELGLLHTINKILKSKNAKL